MKFTEEKQTIYRYLSIILYALVTSKFNHFSQTKNNLFEVQNCELMFGLVTGCQSHLTAHISANMLNFKRLLNLKARPQELLADIGLQERKHSDTQ